MTLTRTRLIAGTALAYASLAVVLIAAVAAVYWVAEWLAAWGVMQ